MTVSFLPLIFTKCSRISWTHGNSENMYQQINQTPLTKMYPRLGICSYDSCDRPHAITLGNEAKARDDGGFREGRHLSRSQLLHLTLGEMTSKSQKQLVSMTVQVQDIAVCL